MSESCLYILSPYKLYSNVHTIKWRAKNGENKFMYRDECASQVILVVKNPPAN